MSEKPPKILTLQFCGTVIIVLSLLLATTYSYQAEAGLLSVLRKAAKTADGDGISINPRLDFSDLKAIKVKPGTAKAVLSTKPDGSLLIKAEGGQELILGGNMDIAKTLTQFKNTLKTSDGSKVKDLNIYIKERDLFAAPTATPILRQIDKLQLVSSKGNIFPLHALKNSTKNNIWGIGVRKKMVVIAANANQMEEALWRMQKSFNHSDVHILAFDNKAPSQPEVLPKWSEGVPDPTPVNPAHLKNAMATLRGKKLIITGQVKGNQLVIKSQSGGEQIIQIDKLKSLASTEDIDLIIVGKKSPKQPVKKRLFSNDLNEQMKKALKAQTYGDFVEAIHGDKSMLILETEISSANRVTFHSLSAEKTNQPGMLSKILDEIDPAAIVVSESSKKLVEVSVDLHAKSKEWQLELDSRIVPGIPSMLQFLYIANIVLGLVGWTISRWVWLKLWPPKSREQFQNFLTFVALRTFRLFVFIFVFLGLTGSLMALMFFIKQIFDWVRLAWLIITWPIRVIIRMFTPSKA